MDRERSIAALTARLEGARAGVAFTGAGISTESGIPDFRSPGGVWATQRPVEYRDFIASPSERERYWAMRHASWPEMRQARPNAGHRALAALEDAGRIRGVVTQNIDGLHQLAGSRRVLELHGTVRAAGCIGCGQEVAPDAVHARIDAGEAAPTCDACGAPLKSRTVSFGEALPVAALEEALRWSREADVFLALGSSLLVQPAASLPMVARECGAWLCIVNATETPLDVVADLVVRTGIGEFLDAVRARLGLADPPPGDDPAV